MSLADAASLVLLLAGAGLLRFPDVYTRLYALAKADNLGLGLVVLGLLLRARAGRPASSSPSCGCSRSPPARCAAPHSPCRRWRSPVRH